jgi:hypothetical protein
MLALRVGLVGRLTACKTPVRGVEEGLDFDACSKSYDVLSIFASILTA